jgi:hypothetical protein
MARNPSRRHAMNADRISALDDRIRDARKDADADFKADRITAHEWTTRRNQLDARSNRIARLA